MVALQAAPGLTAPKGGVRDAYFSLAALPDSVICTSHGPVMDLFKACISTTPLQVGALGAVAA